MSKRSFNQGLNGLTPLAYLGVTSNQPPDLATVNRDPVTTDVRGYYLGQFWLNTLVVNGVPNNGLWYLANVRGNVAVWLKLSGGVGSLITLTGNSGGAVSPLVGNINVIGDGTTVNVVGNPATNTLTISTTGTSLIATTTITSASSPYTVLTTDNFIGANSTGGAITVLLPNAPAIGSTWIVKDTNGTAVTNNITVTTVGGAVLIDGATTFVMNTAYQGIRLVFQGTFYSII